MRRTMGSIYRNLFYKRFQFRPVNGSKDLSGTNGSPSSVHENPQTVTDAERTRPAAAQSSPRTTEFDFMDMLRDPEIEARAERSTRLQ